MLQKEGEKREERDTVVFWEYKESCPSSYILFCQGKLEKEKDKRKLEKIKVYT
jgi:hypothetical protein